MPPGSIVGRNLRSEGSFIARSTFGRETTGESIGDFESRTWQFDVPERISGPYEGSHETSYPASRPASASTSPSMRTPWPPNPATLTRRSSGGGGGGGGASR